MTPRIGDNSSAQLDGKVREIVHALNKCRAGRRALNDDEKSVKANLKAKGLSPRAQAIGRRARKSKKEDPAAVLESALQFIEGKQFADERAELDRIADEKREIAAQERALRKAAQDAGVEVRTLPIIRSMQDMDSIEREEFFDGIVNGCRALQFW